MGLFSIFKKKKADDEHFLVLDIGSNSVKVLVIKSDETANKGYVVGYGQENLPFTGVSHRQIQNINLVVDKCTMAIDNAAALSGVKPSNVIVGLSGTKLKSEINKAAHTRKKPEQKINHIELQNIFQELQKESKKQLIKKHESGKTSDNMELVNAAILKVSVDGTPVDNPINFLGREIEITYYVSYAPLLQIGALQSVIDELRLNLVSIVNESYALCKSFDLDQYQYRDCLLLDIGGDTTNIAYVQEGMILFTSCIDLGCREFVQTLAKNLDISLEKADQYLKDYCDDLLAEETVKEFNQLFVDIAALWRTNLINELKRYNIDEFSKKIFICGGGSLIPEIKQILADRWPDKINFSGQPIIKTIHPFDVENIVDKTTHIKNAQDINIMSLANIGLKIGNIDGVAEKFYKRVMQSIRT